MKVATKTVLTKTIDKLVKSFAEELTKVFKEEIRNLLEETARRFEPRRGPGRPRKTETAVKATKKPGARHSKPTPKR